MTFAVQNTAERISAIIPAVIILNFFILALFPFIAFIMLQLSFMIPFSPSFPGSFFRRYRRFRPDHDPPGRALHNVFKRKRTAPQGCPPNFLLYFFANSASHRMSPASPLHCGDFCVLYHFIHSSLCGPQSEPPHRSPPTRTPATTPGRSSAIPSSF